MIGDRQSYLTETDRCPCCRHIVISDAWESYYRKTCPIDSHFHLGEVCSRTEQNSLSGARWTGKFHSLGCLVVRPHAMLVVDRVSGEWYDATDDNNWVLNCNEEFITKVEYVSELMFAACNGKDLSDPDFFRRQGPWMFIHKLNLPEDWFGSFLTKVSWDDCLDIDGYHDIYEPMCRPDICLPMTPTPEPYRFVSVAAPPNM